MRLRDVPRAHQDRTAEVAPLEPGTPDPTAAAASARRDVLCSVVADFVHAKGGAMRPSYAMLCLMYCLERDGDRATTAADVKAILPRLGDVVDGRLRSPADTLRRARDERLVETVGAGAYRLTALGAAVVDALPDAARVGAIRGTQRVRCRRRLVSTGAADAMV